MIKNGISKSQKSDTVKQGKEVKTFISRSSILQKGVLIKKKWEIHGSHLICDVPSLDRKDYILEEVDDDLIKIAAFDLDGTLVQTKTGMKFARGPDDWKWFKNKEQQESTVKKCIRELCKNKYLIVVFTNQGGVIANRTNKSFLSFTTRCDNIMQDLKSDQTLKDILVYAAPKLPASKKLEVTAEQKKLHGLMRKPNIGMWQELVNFLQSNRLRVDMSNSFYVGDAAGRKTDFSDSDLKFAENIGIQFKTPEEYFTE